MDSPFRADCAEGLVVLVTGYVHAGSNPHLKDCSSHKSVAYRRRSICCLCSGGSGIGHGICEVFAAHGAKIAMFGRRKAVLDKACTSLKGRWPACDALGVAGDVRSPESCASAVAAVVERFGRMDVLVNAAAGNFMALAEDLGGRGFKTVIEIDLQGTFNMAVAALSALSLTKSPRKMPKLAGSPVIVNISATLQYKALPFQAHASAAKAAIDSLTKTLGVEWAADHQVRVTGIAPGPIAGTEGGPTGRVFGAALVGQDVADIVPLGRVRCRGFEPWLA